MKKPSMGNSGLKFSKEREREKKREKILNQNSVYNQSQECVKGKRKPLPTVQPLEEKN